MNSTLQSPYLLRVHGDYRKVMGRKTPVRPTVMIAGVVMAAVVFASAVLWVATVAVPFLANQVLPNNLELRNASNELVGVEIDGKFFSAHHSEFKDKLKQVRSGPYAVDYR